MKKLFSTIICVFVFSGILFVSKSRAQAGPQFGIRGGLNIATLNNTDMDTENLAGFAAGFYFNYPLGGSSFSLQPELLYSQKGFEANGDTYRVHYLEVPLLARFDFAGTHKITPFIYAGPHIGFLLDSDFPPQVIYNIGLAYSNSAYYPVNDGDTNSIDAGITMGGGLNLGRIEVGLRYEAGLTEAFDDDNLHEKNSVFSITAGIGF